VAGTPVLPATGYLELALAAGRDAGFKVLDVRDVKIRRPLALADDAALLAPLLAAAGSAHLVGHSYGGAVALKAAALYPAQVCSVTAYEPVLFRLLDGDAGSAAAVRAVRAVAGTLREELAQGRAELAAQRFVDFWSGTGAWQSMPPVRQQAIAPRMPAVARHFDALFADTLAAADLQRVGVPMLLLTGGDTADATRRIGALLQQALPHVQHATLPGAGHMAPLTDPARVNAYIADFLAAAIARQRAWERRQPAAQPQLAA
jgi:pimeloyl-ACP methyl ester carboxylesterase